MKTRFRFGNVPSPDTIGVERVLSPDTVGVERLGYRPLRSSPLIVVGGSRHRPKAIKRDRRAA